MQPHFKIVIVAENASDLLSKSRELARELTGGASVIEQITGTQSVGSHDEEDTRPVAADSVQTAPRQQAQAATSTGNDRDSVGMPWDSRIHMENRKQKADGTWQNKRGLDANVKAQVEAELRGGSLPQGSVPQAANTNQLGMPQQQAAMPAPFAPPTQPPAAPAAPQMGIAHGHTAETFAKNLPLILMELSNAGKLSEQYVGQLKAWLQISELVDVVKDAAKTQQLFDLFVTYKFIQKA